MLDLRFFDQNLNDLEQALKKRNFSSEFISEIAGLSSKRRELIHQVESKKAARNKASQEIAQLKAKAKSDPEAAKQAEVRILEMRAVGDQIKVLDEELRTIEAKLSDTAMRVPNIPHSSVPAGADASDKHRSACV